MDGEREGEVEKLAVNTVVLERKLEQKFQQLTSTRETYVEDICIQIIMLGLRMR